MLDFLYMIFIYPVYMFVEFVFFLANNVTDDYIGFSIIILSITVNIICLPIYNVAEQWQEKERDIQKKLKSKIRDIKAVFSGDERYMILSTYYRQNHYHPIYGLRGMFPLLIQIPFFMAAYKLLSGLPILNNSSFWFLNDLGKPDKLLHIGGVYINFLPILMTIINIFASAVYLKGLSLKEKLQLYIMAAIFFILLYNSPSGLVFYWTLNNVFSLLKNIFYKIRLDNKVWYLAAVIFSVLLVILSKRNSSKLRVEIIVQVFAAGVIFIPIIWMLASKFLFKNISNVFSDTRLRFSLFLQSLIALFVFLGLVIPSSVISSSTLEFINFENISSPFTILFYSGVQSIGCVFWFICLYKLFNKNVQVAFTFIFIIILMIAILNAYVFQDSYGSINNLLMFSDTSRLRHSFKEIIINISVIGMLSFIVFIILYSQIFIKYVNIFLKILVVSFLSITFISFIRIYKDLSLMKTALNSVSVPEKAYKITRTGKNIILLMLDRSMNFFIDPIFETSEIVKKEYTGFTLFENAIAFGHTTNFSTPSLFGGYEYTPENIDKRSDELLVDKHNEALSVLPRLFSENNWSVSFTDPSWLNYSWIPDLSVFKNYNVIAKNIDGIGLYTKEFITSNTNDLIPQNGIYGIRRNMLYFSFFKILPIEARRIFYADGMYGGVEILIYSMPFFNAYSAIENIESEVEFVDHQNCLNIIVNNITHEPPAKETIKMIDKDFLIPLAQKFCLNEYTEDHFYANYLAHEACAKFFKFLKDNNCWDNTRIIIAGDHGRGGVCTVNMDFIKNFSSDIEPESMIPLLMIKDFSSVGALKRDFTFMTLADIPSLATERLSPDLQKNPFTGISFKDSQDKTSVKIVISGNWYANHQLNFKQFEVKSWAMVKDNVYDNTCWSIINAKE